MSAAAKTGSCGRESKSSRDSLIIVTLPLLETIAIVILKSSSDAASSAELTGESGLDRTASAIFLSCKSIVSI
jgi:hypothetical protein